MKSKIQIDKDYFCSGCLLPIVEGETCIKNEVGGYISYVCLECQKGLDKMEGVSDVVVKIGSGDNTTVISKYIYRKSDGRFICDICNRNIEIGEDVVLDTKRGKYERDTRVVVRYCYCSKCFRFDKK